MVHTDFISSVYREARLKPLWNSDVSKYNGRTPSSVKFSKALVEVTMPHVLSI